METLYCKVFVEGATSRDALIATIASHFDGAVSGRTVTAPYLELDIIDNDDFDGRRTHDFSTGFIHSPWFLDVEPAPGATRSDYIRQLTGLLLRLRWNGLQVVAACAFEDELPPNRAARVICEVAGASCDQAAMAARELGFGTIHDVERPLPWSARFDLESFLGLAGPLYRVLCDETRHEVASGLEPDPLSLAAAGYPALKTLISGFPEAFEEVFVGHLAIDFSHWWLGAHETFRYVVTRIERATLSPDASSVLLTGKAYAV